jgi:hypothetical protein
MKQATTAWNLGQRRRLKASSQAADEGPVILQLRNEYRVSRTSGGYDVTAVDRHDVRHTLVVALKFVQLVRRALRGNEVGVPDAATVLSESELDLPYSYGHKLNYFAQAVLVALVACDAATHRKAGRKFVYTIR